METYGSLFEMNTGLYETHKSLEIRMNQSTIEETLIKLGKVGCSGSIQDFQSWLQYEHLDVEPSKVKSALEDLRSSGTFKSGRQYTGDYQLHETGPFPDSVSYSVPCTISGSILQMVRSRLDAFLHHHGVSEDSKTDIILGITEAMENALKYGVPESQVRIQYSIAEKKITIKIENDVPEVSPHRDIQKGKYRDGSVTLMRGLLVMQKLFDSMELEIQEESRVATFFAEKKIH